MNIPKRTLNIPANATTPNSSGMSRRARTTDTPKLTNWENPFWQNCQKRPDMVFCFKLSPILLTRKYRDGTSRLPLRHGGRMTVHRSSRLPLHLSACGADGFAKTCYWPPVTINASRRLHRRDAVFGLISCRRHQSVPPVQLAVRLLCQTWHHNKSVQKFVSLRWNQLNQRNTG